MPVYMIFAYNITDSEQYTEYRSQVGDTLMAHGARILTTGADAKPLEGSTPQVMVVIEFETPEAAEGWYNSPEYQAIAGLRKASSDGFVMMSPAFNPAG